ncbi:MAG: carboxypeptidase M32 [Solirubrobacterales bacterium]|nr:carboxypeptidase M32 [Solirubrobacterales bacterium]
MTQVTTDPFNALRERLAELADLRSVAQLLDWDQQTMMPPRGAPARAETVATVQRLSHEMFVADETGRLLAAAAAHLDGAPPDSDDAALVRVVTRRWEKARRVPSKLAADLARAASIGQQAWIAARRDADFAGFAPYLERNFELVRRYIDCFDDFDCAYDALLDDYEPGGRTAEVSSLFDELKGELRSIINALSDRAGRVDDSFLHGHFPVDGQRRLVTWLIEQMGFDRAGWRIDDAIHPFATGFGNRDVRITTRWDERFLPTSLYGAMHECGHGLYEEGVAQSLQRTPLGHPESLALHESQSRLWENMVGRGRPFCGVLVPRIAEVFGDGARVGVEEFYRAVNRVTPSLIRVEADEVTYSLHIVVRFELEQELVEGRLAVRDLPEAWNARYEEYLGIPVPDDAQGVLQDVHWSSGLIGYFPTYALGNLIAGQLFERAHQDVPDLDAQLSAGQLHDLREWLRDKVHRHGAKFSTAELLPTVVGGPIEVGPFIAYLKGKLSQVYDLDLR